MIAAALKHMLAAGMDHAAIVAAVADMEASIGKDAQAERRREKDRIRKAEARLRKSADSADGAEPSPLDKEKTPTPPKEINPPLTPRAALETVLDSVRAVAVVDHRKKLGKPLTAHAAQLLATKLSGWPDPNFAADEMIANGWQGFKPEWLEKQQPRAASPPPPREPRNAGERAFLKLQGSIDEPPSPANGRLDPGDGRRQIEGSGIARRFAVAAGAGG